MIPGASTKLIRDKKPNQSPDKNKAGAGEVPKHHLTFRDRAEKGARVCDVYIVESYKKYN